MPEKQSLRVEAQAAMVLAGWKSLFAETVCAEAKQLAKRDASNTITLAHFQEAAGIALISLNNAIPNRVPMVANSLRQLSILPDENQELK